jgi:hypothetical protein
LKLIYDEALSYFAFTFALHCYVLAAVERQQMDIVRAVQPARRGGAG